MIHKLQKTFCLVVFLCTGIFFSRCQNEDAEFDNKEPAVISAKKWFENNNLNMEALAFTESIDWENAILTKAENKNAIEVPLILNENTTTNVVEDLDYRTYMRLLFVQDTEDNYEVYDIVYTTKNPAFDNNSKAFSLHNIGRDFSGYITLQNSQNKIIYSAQYEKGEQTTLHNNTSKGAIASKLVCTYYVTVGPYTTCSNWVYMPDDTVIPGFYPPGMGGGPIPPMVTPAWQNSVLNLPQVNLKISNRSEYLKCFDPNATGVLHVYIDQPVPNNAIAYTMNSGVPDVGHTFLALEQNGNVSVIGYYPNDGVNPFTSPTSAPAYVNDSGHSYDVKITKPLNPSQMGSVISGIINYGSQYNLNTNNCSDFAQQIASLGGLSLPNTNGSWPGGSGTNPGNLGQDVRAMPVPAGGSKNTTGGKALSNTKCN